MKCQGYKKRIYKLKLIFILILNLTNGSICHGMDGKLDEETESQYIIVKYPPTTEIEVNDSPGEAKHIPSDLIEEVIFTKSSNISQSYILAFQDDMEPIGYKCLTFKYLASLLGFGAGIPLVGAALQAGKYYGSEELGYYFASANILCAGGIVSWMIWDLIENSQDFIERSRKNDKHSRICHTAFIKGVGKALLSLFLGALSTVPDVYTAYKYNDVKEIALMTFFYEIVPRTMGFYKFISSINFKIVDRAYQEENIVKNQGLEFIDLSKAYFLKLSKENGIEEVRISLGNYSSSKEIYSFLSSNFRRGLIENTEEVLPSYYAKGRPRKAVQVISVIFPLANTVVATVLTYKGFNLITDDPVALVLLTAVSVFPTLVLNAYGTIQVSGGLFDKIYSYLNVSKVESSDYFGTFYPKIKITFIATSLFLAASAAGGGVYIILDNLDNTFLSPAKYILSTLAITSTVTFGSYAVTTTLINFGEAITKHTSKTASYLFNCLKKLNDFRIQILNTSSEHVSEFLDEIESTHLVF